MGRALIAAIILAGCARGQSLELPTQVTGEPGAFITIKPTKLEGAKVRYVSIDSGLSVFPAELLTDPTATVVVGSKPGRYRVLGYTAKGDVPSLPAYTVVVIGSPGPAPGPEPTPPPPPPPPPDDAFAQALRGIYGGLQDPNKATKAATLAKVFQQGMILSRDSEVKTIGGLLGGMRALTRIELKSDDLRPLRDRIADEAEKVLPVDPAVVLTDEHRTAAVKFCEHVAKIMEGLR
jgi:hypothetical protein